MVLSDKELSRISDFMKNHYGIELEKKRTLIVGRLENHLSRRGFSSYDEYMKKVEQDPKGEEAVLLVNQLTTNHTFFMREPVHFDYMKDVILPKLRVSEERDKDIRIWSAASSTGEEAYSIVMVLKDFFGFDAPDWDTKVLATDISTKVLNTAREGVFTKAHVESLPPRWLKQYFLRISDDEYQVKKEIRDEVLFRTFNLMDTFPFKRKFHIVFLRNVMIYFDDDTKRMLINKIYEFLEPGGYLFTGTTEALDKSATRLQYIQPSIYRK